MGASVLTNHMLESVSKFLGTNVHASSNFKSRLNSRSD